MRKGALSAIALIFLLFSVSCMPDPDKVEVDVQCFMEIPSDTVEIRLRGPYGKEMMYTCHSEDGEPFESHVFSLTLEEGNWSISGTAWLEGNPSGFAKRVMLPFKGFENPGITINFYEPGWLEEDEI